MNLIESLTDLLLGVVLVCAVVAAAILLSPSSEIAPRNVGHGTIWEDDVKWDCETMDADGCGPAGGPIELVTPEDSYIYHA